MPLHLIWAEDQAGGIGQDGDLPWRQRTDLQRFKALTLGHAVVMGRRTWESLPFPLPGRENLVLSRDPSWSDEGAERTTVEEVKIPLRGRRNDVRHRRRRDLRAHASRRERGASHRGPHHRGRMPTPTHHGWTTAGWSLESSERVGAQEGDQHDQTFERWAR